MRSADYVLSSIQEILKTPEADFTKIGDEIPIPKFGKLVTESLFNDVIDYLASEPQTLVDVTGNTIVVGDLHGDFVSLVRILSLKGLPNKINYVFLGDYCDRGDYSVETLMVVLALFMKWPTKVTLLRGNHEFREINAIYGLKESITQLFGDDSMWELANTVFEYLPLAALVNSTILCIHGGLSNKMHSTSALKHIKLPLRSYTGNAIVEDLVWGDPTDMGTMDGEENEQRGHGHLFGKFRTDNFLKENFLKCIIRGHSVVDGWETFFMGSLHGVHTSQRGMNRAGFIEINDDNLKGSRLDVIQQIPRSMCFFFDAKDEDHDEDGRLKMGFISKMKSAPNGNQLSASKAMLFARKDKNGSVLKMVLGTTNRTPSRRTNLLRTNYSLAMLPVNA